MQALPPVEPDDGTRRNPFEVLKEKLDQLQQGLSRPQLIPFTEVLIEERFRASTLLALGTAIQRQRITREVGGDVDLYDPSLLYWHPDFRVLLSLATLERTAKAYGVSSEVQPVLSLPLGAKFAPEIRSCAAGRAESMRGLLALAAP